MFKLILEKAEEPEIKLSTSTGLSKKQESSRKTSISALFTTPRPLTVDHNKLWEILQEMGIPDHLNCLLRNLHAGQEAAIRNGHGTDWLQIRKFTVHGLSKPGLENFEHYFASLWDECNCAVVWTFFGIAFLWDWNENGLSSPTATAELSKFAGILSVTLSQHHLLGFEK